MIINTLKKDFYRVFNRRDPIGIYFAPGRVNLIGEHTDYNGGHVFPCALSFGTFAIATIREDSKLRLYSKNFQRLGILEADINQLVYDREHDWANYPKGVIRTFKDYGLHIEKGLDILYFGDIPNGAGLSSSASIEMVTAMALKKLFHLDVSMMEMVLLSQRAENQFVGVNCGIMDQFAIGMGKAGHGILLDTNTLHHRYAPIHLEGISIVIVNTNKRRDLMESKYNERRRECERALHALQQKMKITNLGDLTEEEFEEFKLLIEGDIERKRAKHVVYENQRTIKAVLALNRGDITTFGELINQSHISLRDDYNVSCMELDTLVESAWRQGALGSRMTGAGFGGCTVNLVRNHTLDNFIHHVGREYKDKIGYPADFYVASIGDGAREVVKINDHLSRNSKTDSIWDQ